MKSCGKEERKLLVLFEKENIPGVENFIYFK
jgi:hypothetical protein